MHEYDKSSKWLIQHHGDSILRLAGVTEIETWKPLQAELIQPIFDRINKVLGDIRVEDGYTAILDVNPGNGAGTVVALDKNLDITDRVIARVKALPVASSAPSTTGTGVGAGSSNPATAA